MKLTKYRSNVASNLKIITSPTRLHHERLMCYKFRLFLVGANNQWVNRAIELINATKNWEKKELLIFNPIPDNDTNSLSDQIEWEYDHLNIYTNIYWFWFTNDNQSSNDNSNQMALYELGRATRNSFPHPIFVGAEPSYNLRAILREQLIVSRPEIELVDSLPALVSQLLVYVAQT